MLLHICSSLCNVLSIINKSILPTSWLDKNPCFISSYILQIHWFVHELCGYLVFTIISGSCSKPPFSHSSRCCLRFYLASLSLWTSQVFLWFLHPYFFILSIWVLLTSLISVCLVAAYCLTYIVYFSKSVLLLFLFTFFIVPIFEKIPSSYINLSLFTFCL